MGRVELWASYHGDIYDKNLPWFVQILQYCKELVGVGTVETWMRGDFPKITMQPIETVRGSSFDNSIILIDEAQQLTYDELKCLSTRIGQNSKIILTGDVEQRDVKTHALEGFVRMCKKNEIPGFTATEFQIDDIVRSDIVKHLIIAYQKEEGHLIKTKLD